MFKRYLSFLLIVVMMASSLVPGFATQQQSDAVFAFQYEPANYLEAGKVLNAVLNLKTSIGTDISAVEWTVKGVPGFELTRVTFGGVTVTPSLTSAISEDRKTLGVSQVLADGSLKVAFSKTGEGSWTLPADATVGLAVKGLPANQHVVQIEALVSELQVIKADGSVHIVDPSLLENKVVGKVVSNTLVSVRNAFASKMTMIKNKSAITLADEALVKLARSNYQEYMTLTGSFTSYIEGIWGTDAELVAFENQIANMKKAASDVDVAIEALPAPENMVLTAKAAYDTVKGQYDTLDVSQKALVKQTNITKLGNVGIILTSLTQKAAAYDLLLKNTEALDARHIVGPLKDNVTAEAKAQMKVALDQGKAFIAGISGKTSAEIEGAVQSLQQAATTFAGAVLTDKDEAKYNLGLAIQAAEAYSVMLQVGDAAGQWPQAAVTELSQAIAAAKTIHGGNNQTASGYLQAKSLLEQAQTICVGKVITELDVAKRTLGEKIVEAKGLLGSSIVGALENQYTLESKQAFAAAVQQAELSDRSTVALVNAAIKALGDATTVFAEAKLTKTDEMRIKVNALFTTTEKTVLVPAVTLSGIESLKTVVEALPVSLHRSSQLADLEKAKTIFLTPVKVDMYPESGSMSIIEVGKTVQLKANVYNALNVKLEGVEVEFSTTSTTQIDVSKTGLVTGLVLGKAAVQVKVKDKEIKAINNMIVIPTPELIVSNIPMGAFFNKDVTVNAYYSGKQVEIFEGVTPLATGQEKTNAVIAQPGAHEITVKADGKTMVLRFTIDKTAPTLSVPAIADQVDQAVTIPAVQMADDNLSDEGKALWIEKKVDGTFKFLKFVSATEKVSEQGEYQLVAVAKDLAGNETRKIETFKITLDLGKPVIQVTGFSAMNKAGVTPVVTVTGGTNAAKYNYVATLTQPGNQVTVKKTGETFGVQSVSGVYKLEVVAYNPNHGSLVSQSVSEFLVDTQKPTIVIGGVSNGAKLNTAVTPFVQISDNDGVANETFTLTRNGVSISYVKGATLSAEGSYELTAEATDRVGHKETKSVAFTIDKTAPVIQIGAVKDLETYTVVKTGTFRTDADAVLTVLVDGQPVTLTNGAYTFDKKEGEAAIYKVAVKAADAAGNQTFEKLTFTVDALPVKFQITGLAEGSVVNAIPLNISAKVLDGAVETVVQPEITDADKSELTAVEGLKVLKVSFKKGDTTYTKSIHFTVDGTKPVFEPVVIKKNDTIQNGPFTAKAGDLIEIRATVSDASSQVKSVKAWIGSLTVPVVLNPVDNAANVYAGVYRVGTGNLLAQWITVNAEDLAGNAENKNVLEMTVDNLAPGVSMALLPDAAPKGDNQYFNHAQQQVILASNDLAAEIFVSVNGSNDVKYTGALTPTEGFNAYRFYAVDTVGNKSTVKNMSFKYDGTAPAGVSALNHANAAVLNTAVTTISGQVAGEGGKGTSVVLEVSGNIVGVARVLEDHSFAFSNVQLKEGGNSIKLYARDAAGNVSASSTLELVCDTTAPILELLTGSNPNTYEVQSNEAIAGQLSASFNGVDLAAGDIVAKPNTANTFIVTTPAPVSGQNLITVTGKDASGNIGTGSLSTSFLPPALAQEDVQITENTRIDIPAGAFGATTVLTVQTVEVNGSVDYKPLGAPVKYDFSVKPEEPIVITSFVGIGLTGVGSVHISDAGVVDHFIPAIYQSPINLATIATDQPYYDQASGQLVLKTKNFSTYQSSQDVTSPVIQVTTTDFDIKVGETANLAGTLTDQDPSVKVTSVSIDGVATAVSLASPFNHALALTDGTHEVVLTAKDAAGNTSTVTKTYRVDKTTPVLNAAAVIGTTTESQAEITVNTSELVTLSVNGTAAGNIHGASTLVVNLANGANTFTIRGEDGFGNVTTQTITINKVAAMSFTMSDVQSPTTSATVTLSGNVNVTADVYVNDQLKLSKQPAGNFSIPGLALALGSNTLTVKAIDTSGVEKSQTVTIQRNAEPTNNNGGNNSSGSNNSGSGSSGSTGGSTGGGGGFVPFFPSGPTTALPTAVTKPVVPAESSSLKVISALGGAAEFKALGIVMNFAVNAFADKTDVKVTEAKFENGKVILESGKAISAVQQSGGTQLKVAGKIFDIETSSKLERPVTLTVSFDASKFTKEEMKQLGVYYLNESTGKWVYMKSKVDAASGQISFTTDHFSVYAVMSLNKTFGDLDKHWAKSYIESLASRHVISGINEETFAPNQQMTRGEFAALIVNALHIPMTEQTGLFKDVKTSDWYAKAVFTAKNSGLISGYEDQTFKPNATISRQEMAVMVMNAYNYMTKSDYAKTYTGSKLGFADSQGIGSWAAKAVEGAKALNIIGGKAGNLFDPKAMTNRAEVAKMIHTLLSLQE